MNRIKKCVMLILSLVIVMTGIYLWANPTKEVQAETTTEANPDMLSLKFQRGITEATSNKIRVVASVDSPNYSAVGFEIAKDGGEATKFTIDTKQYPLPQRIKSSVEGMEYSFSPKVVDTSSEYFLTGKWTAVAGTKYTVRAWVKTFGGDMIYGQSRCITLEDLSTTDYLNMSFQLKDGCTLSESTEDATKYADINVTYNGTSTTAKVVSVKGSTVHVNVQNVNRTELPSATKFVFKNSENVECGSNIFRNLYTEYSETTSGDGTTTNTADTSWYNVYHIEDNTEDEFIIATNADMYGFAQLVNDGNSFADTKVYMVSNIALNKGLATESSWDTKQDLSGQAITDGTNYEWISIGYNDTNNFKGNFDAQGHEVTGLLDTVLEGSYQGMFGWANTSSSIKKLYLKNSYIEANNSNGTGSITGRASGAIDMVYSNANILCSNAPVGGIVGKYQAESKTDAQQFTNLKYDGTIQITSSTSASPYVGGILGMARRGALTIDDCLFSGNIKVSQSNEALYVGGVLGGVYRVTKTNDYVVVTIQNNLNSGVLEIGENVEVEHSVALFGYLLTGSSDTGTSTFNINDSYYTNEGDWGDSWYEGTTSSQTGQTSTEALEVSQSEITGLASYYNQILVHTTDTAWVPTTGTVELKAFAQSPMSVNEPDDINLDWYTGIADSYTICGETDTNDVKVAKLRGFAYLVNGGVSFKDKAVYLGADVTLNQEAPATKAEWDTYIEANTLEEWTPIGENDYGFEFSGTFDGGSNSINGIYVDSDNEGIGFFRSTSDESTIQNLKIENSYFKTSSYYVGSVVASCGGNIDNLYSNAVVVSSNSYSGGLIGQIWNTGVGTAKTISKCWYAGEMSVANNAGGLIGVIAQGKIDVVNCLYTGNLQYNSSGSNKRIGGLCGRLALTDGEWTGEQATETRTIDLEMINCLSMGDIQDGTKSRIGSIIGEKSAGKAPTFTNVYATKESYCYNETDYPLVGYGVSDTTGITQHLEADLTVLDSTSKEDVQSKLVGFDFVNTWTIGIDGKPALASFAETIDVAWYDGDGIIDTRAELVGLSYLSQTQSIDKHITLAADIDLNPGWTASETSGRPDIVWSPVGNEQYPFTGTFNANGHIISGIYIDDAIEYMGFFGVTGDSSEIKNLRIENSYFNQQVTEGNGYVGSVVGDLRGSMTNVYSNAIVKSNYEQIAGMVARVNANTSPVNITDCWFDGTVIGGTSGRYLGGIVSMIVDGTCNFENVLFTGVIDSDYSGSEQVTIGGIVADGMSESEKIAFESIISAGKIIGNHNHRAVHAILGNVRTGILNNGTTSAIAHMPEVALSNVFASRTCYPTAYSHASATTGILIDENSEKVAITSQVTVTGQVMFTTGDDRLLGYIPQTIHLTDTDTDVTSVLGFYENGDWSLRKDGVPIPTALTDLVDTEISDVDYLSETDEKYQSIEGYLTKQIRLDWFGGSIDDLVAYGAGNYLTSYTNIDKTKYTDYLTKISANNRKFKEYTNTSTDAMELDGVYSAVYKREDIEWVLNITYVEKISTIYISVNTDLNSISSHLKPVTTSGTAPISFSMLEMQNSEKLGNSFVFQLPDGHFIVNDGGKRDDATYLLNYLKALAGTSNGEQNPVYIDAWIVTHYHSDHCGAMANLTADEKVFIEAVYACEPSMYGLTAEENVYGNVNAALKGVTKFTKRDGTRPDFYQLHMGQRFYFNGITMDVIDTQEQNLEGKLTNKPSPDKFNSTSTSCIYTFEDANDTTQRVIIGGDANNANMTYIMGAFGDGQGKSNTLSDINVYVAFHHGLNTTCTRVSGDYKVDGEGYRYRRIGTTDWADFLLNNITGGQFDIVLFPNTIVESASPRVDANGEKWYLTSTGLKDFSYNIGDMNQYFIDNTVEKRHYTYGTGDSTGESHGTVMITFDGNNQSTLYIQGSFTETINKNQ